MQSAASSTAADNAPSPNLTKVPTVELPKGGGAVRGIGEKFAANPVTGTGSMSVPIAASPGRSGFGPQLSLSYDSGAGNGPFGFGWSLSLPSITRKTDKGLPRYLDAEDSDVFVLSGAEDLVPALLSDGSPQVPNPPDPDYAIRRYRPRVEGLFARIERWTRKADGDVHWRSISKDNILTLYGRDSTARIHDPADPRRVFSWLISETRDDKGNCVVYEYKAEDGAGVDLSQAHERNRGALDDARRAVNRYIKFIRYGNRVPLLNGAGKRPRFLSDLPVDDPGWMFEVVFDYGEGHVLERPAQGDGHTYIDASPIATSAWSPRVDPFSIYRAGFEVRTSRLCQSVLMFHHIPDLPGGEPGYDGLVRSTDFTYSDEQDPRDARNPVYTFLNQVTQSGYKRQGNSSLKHFKRSLPPLEFEYSKPIVQHDVQDVDAASLENLPIGLDGSTYQWTDLHGEGIPGILTEQAGSWFYKRNLSPINDPPAAFFAPLERVASQPNLALAGGQSQFMDLAGDGQPDLVVLGGPVAGLYEHDKAEGWQAFRPFTARLNRDLRDPNLKFVDLDGDGHADVLITEDDAFVWHASLGEAGFGPAQRLHQALDEEKGPRLVFADGEQSIYLADLSGDGLTDLVRIRNGEVCYWPQLGYCRFGAKVTMDQPPHFDNPDQFDQRRIRLADIDGSGTTDIIYLHRDGVRLYFNQSGNSWGSPVPLDAFPRIDNLTAVMPADLLGNGTACLVWSSPMQGDARRPMRYVNLVGREKPHLLKKTVNNLGAETVVQYAPSTKFYLLDKLNGRPWITRLPFPVHVVERVETYDRISRNRFVTRFQYHHGYFDGEEREFRGFGMVEQWDTEELAALGGGGALPIAANLDAASHVPPVHTKTWFHTGVYLGRDHVSDFFAGLLDAQDQGEYYREPGLTDAQARALLLPDTALPPGLTLDEEREACRALKGSMLRKEIYADDARPDATAAQIQRAETPYTVAEQNFSVRLEQPRGGNRHAVFFTHPREAITYHYERNPADPRTQHALTLEVDRFGNVLREVAIGYGRRNADASLPTDEDRAKQKLVHITCTENTVTNALDGDAESYRAPLPAETRTYELRKPAQEKSGDGPPKLHEFGEILGYVQQAGDGLHDVVYEDVEFNHAKQAAANDPNEGEKYFRRLIEHVRTRYRTDDLTTLLPLGELQPLALPGEAYKLAFTPGLLTQVFQRAGVDLLPVPANVLAGQGADRGGYVDLDADGRWWLPAGRVFLSPSTTDTSAQELAHARQHFYLPHRTRDPFGSESLVTYDAHKLLIVDTRDALGNRVTVGERLRNGTIDATQPGNDYRTLQPSRVMDPNRNRTQVAFDALGMVVGTAVMGKPEEIPVPGDRLLPTFDTDLTQAKIDQFLADPKGPMAAMLLGDATTRIVYDLTAYWREPDIAKKPPAVAATLARETHASEPAPSGGLRIQTSLSYSDGFGREIQKKIQAEPSPVPTRDANGKILVGPDNLPQMTPNDVSPRWVGNGWTVFNNKGKPVRQYEPFFTDRHGFEFDVRLGVSPILFYDPVERVVATLHPNHTYEKVVFDPWQQATWDVNDTTRLPDIAGDPPFDPKDDPDAGHYFGRLADDEYLPTWLDLRTDTAKALQAWPDADAQGNPMLNNAKRRASEKRAAEKAAAHAGTPTTAHFDALGRPFLTLADNGPAPVQPGQHALFATRVELDIEGNQRSVRDAIEQNNDPQGRIVMRYAYDMLGNRVHQASMEAGARWMLNDVAGKPIRAWDSRDHAFRTEYDPLRRPLRSLVTGADPASPNQELLTERLVYGEQHPQAELRNLRGKLYVHLDQAGSATTEALDFKGNPLQVSRCLTSGTQYKRSVDWRAVDADHVALPTDATAPLDPAALAAALAPRLEADNYTSFTTYDALNRPVTLTTPHTPATQPSVIRHGYNEANFLERVDANLLGATANGQLVWTPFVVNIDYDAKGQRSLIEYGSGSGPGRKGVTTTYDYDPLTFRLVHLLTRRNAVVFPDDCPQPPPLDWPGCQVQNLHYTYDPVGNITHIRDDAQQTIYFRNRRVEPSAEYSYDAIYRLIEATGREHLGQVGGAPIPHSHNDAPRVGIHWSANDGFAMGTYVEQYIYDGVGNFLSMQHIGSDATIPGWTREYVYAEDSLLLEQGKKSNRLTSTTVGNGAPESYAYDAHGNVTRMNSLPLMLWDYRDQLQATAQQVINNGVPETTWYVYDAGGQRVRKVTDSAVSEQDTAAGETPKRRKERIYLGGFEVYREYEIDGSTPKLARETLHVMDSKQRIALVETRTFPSTPDPKDPLQLIRYQFGNHLGSASLELDELAQIISYEEYAPYGSSTYQAVRSETGSAKRYRYTGKERDEESGLYYHGARYFAPWLGRWTGTDPQEFVDGLNTYNYVRSNPLVFVDDTGGSAAIVAAEGALAFMAADVAIPEPTDLAWPKWVGYAVVAAAAGATIYLLRRGPDPAVPKPDTKPDTKPTTKPDTKPAPKPDPNPKPKAEPPTTGPRPAPPRQAPDTRPRPDTQPKPDTRPKPDDRPPPPPPLPPDKRERRPKERVALDTNTLVEALDKGQLPALELAVRGRQIVIPPQAHVEYLQRGGLGNAPDHEQRKIVAERMLRITMFMYLHGAVEGAMHSDAHAAYLQGRAQEMGRALSFEDARVVSSTIRDDVQLLTRDHQLFGFMNELNPGSAAKW